MDEIGPKGAAASEAPVNRLQKQEKQDGRGPDGRYKPGYSGNRRGRPCGARNRSSLLAEGMLADETENLMRRAIERAMEGDVWALRLCIERILAPRRRERVQFRLPPLYEAKDAVMAMYFIGDAVARGELAPSEASELAKVVETFIQSQEVLRQAEQLETLHRDWRKFAGPPKS